MSAQQRTTLTKEAQAEAKQTGNDASKVQFEKIMSENAEYAELYQDELLQKKSDKEFDWQKIEDVHDRFGYLKNEKKMATKVKDKRYDLPGFVPDTEDEAFSTDLEVDMDPADTEIYRHYRLVNHEIKEEQKEIDASIHELRKYMEASTRGDLKKVKDFRKLSEIKNDLFDKKIVREHFAAEIENHLSTIRFNRMIEKMDPVDLVRDKNEVSDEVFGEETGFSPFLPGDADKDDPDMAGELKKFLDNKEPEV